MIELSAVDVELSCTAIGYKKWTDVLVHTSCERKRETFSSFLFSTCTNLFPSLCADQNCLCVWAKSNCPFLSSFFINENYILIDTSYFISCTVAVDVFIDQYMCICQDKVLSYQTNTFLFCGHA